MKTLLILNDSAYGPERSYNGLVDWTVWADKVLTF